MKIRWDWNNFSKRDACWLRSDVRCLAVICNWIRTVIIFMWIENHVGNFVLFDDDKKISWDSSFQLSELLLRHLSYHCWGLCLISSLKFKPLTVFQVPFNVFSTPYFTITNTELYLWTIKRYLRLFFFIRKSRVYLNLTEKIVHLIAILIWMFIYLCFPLNLVFMNAGLLYSGWVEIEKEINAINLPEKKSWMLNDKKERKMYFINLQVIRLGGFYKLRLQSIQCCFGTNLKAVQHAALNCPWNETIKTLFNRVIITLTYRAIQTREHDVSTETIRITKKKNKILILITMWSRNMQPRVKHWFTFEIHASSHQAFSLMIKSKWKFTAFTIIANIQESIIISRFREKINQWWINRQIPFVINTEDNQRYIFMQDDRRVDHTK